MEKERLTYRTAMEEIESIVALLEGNKLDVDQLSEKVKRVACLVEFCQGKLRKTEEEVEKILASMEEK